MEKQRKYWLIAAAAVLALSGIACGINTVKPTPTMMPPIQIFPTQEPLPTEAPTSQVSLGSFQDMIGSWLDPDTTGTVTTIFGQEGGLSVDSVINPDRGGNELTEQNWDGQVLTWTYCVASGPCVTTKTVAINGDSLYTTWSNNNGDSGATVMQRVTATTVAPVSVTDMSLLAGKWLDPDTSGTITTIVAQGDGYAVESVMNPDRGVNELTETKWNNGVLSWTYCPEGMHCIVSSTVSVDESTMVATWDWADGGSGGTTYFSREP